MHGTIASMLLLLLSVYTWGQEDEEIRFLEARGDCRDLEIHHEIEAGQPTVITIDGMEVKASTQQAATLSCILVYEVNVPEGFQVGVSGIQVSGSYAVVQDAWSMVRVRYQFVPATEKIVLEKRWSEPSLGETTYNLHSQEPMLWSPCGINTLAVSPQIIATPIASTGSSSIALRQIGIDYLVYKRCSETTQ